MFKFENYTLTSEMDYVHHTLDSVVTEDDWNILLPDKYHMPEDTATAEHVKALIKANINVGDDILEAAFQRSATSIEEFLKLGDNTPIVLAVYSEKDEANRDILKITNDLSGFVTRSGQPAGDGKGNSHVPKIGCDLTRVDLIVMNTKHDCQKIPEERLFAFRPKIGVNLLPYVNRECQEAAILSRVFEAVYSQHIRWTDSGALNTERYISSTSAFLISTLDHCKHRVARGSISYEITIPRCVFAYLNWLSQITPGFDDLRRIVRTVFVRLIEALDDDMQLLVLTYLGRAVARSGQNENVIAGIHGVIVDSYRYRYRDNLIFWRHFATFWKDVCCTKYADIKYADTYYLSCISLGFLRVKSCRPPYHPNWITPKLTKLSLRDRAVDEQVKVWQTLTRDYGELLERRKAEYRRQYTNGQIDRVELDRCLDELKDPEYKLRLVVIQLTDLDNIL